MTHSDFTDEDVQRGARAWIAMDSVGSGRAVGRSASRAVLAAVLPEYAKRVRAEALREAAEDLWRTDVAGYNGPAIARLRARADAEEVR